MSVRGVIVAGILAAIAGCGGQHYEGESTADDTTSGSGTGTGVDAGTDSGVDGGVDAGDPVRDRAIALFVRSCTPCHRHAAPVDGNAVMRGVYLETDAEILALASAYQVGRTPMSLTSIVSQRAEGYELMVGEGNQTPMPPRASAYAPWTQDEAREVLAWLRAHR